MNSLALTQGATSLQQCLFQYPEPVSPKEFKSALRKVPELSGIRFYRVNYGKDGVLQGIGVSNAFDNLGPLDRHRKMNAIIDGIFPEERLGLKLMIWLTPAEDQETREIFKSIRSKSSAFGESSE